VKQSDLDRKEEISESFQNGIDKIKNVMEEYFQDIQELYNIDFKNMEDNIKKNAANEEKKYKGIENDIKMLKKKMEKDAKASFEEVESLRQAKIAKNKQTLSIYNREIFRL
jgi:hypothetical protein